jgi:hypothetical protein
VFLDVWLCELPEEVFVAALPILRRTFATFTEPERVQIGQYLCGAPAGTSADADIDHQRAAEVLPLAARYLGLDLS